MQTIENEVQPAHINGVERVKRFVNVHSHCIVSNLERISKISTLPPWKVFCERPWMHWFRFNSWVEKLGAIGFNSSKSLKSQNVKVVSFLNLYLYINFDAWWTAQKHEQTVKECFDIQARGPQSARPGAFAQFAQWSIRPCVWLTIFCSLVNDNTVVVLFKVSCSQARNLGTPRGVKSFLRGAQFF